MNYYIEKHDMEMILDALECLSEHIKHYENNSPNYPWTLDEIDALLVQFHKTFFQSFDNSFVTDFNSNGSK
jgi:hypothetical protein